MAKSAGKDNATVIVDQYLRTSQSGANTNQYKGLQIHALPGLHEFLMQVLIREARAAPCGVLDVAAGTGAMSLRMSDAGYTVTSTDYVSENFRLHDELQFFKADLNLGFPEGLESSFDGVMASEIVEHLENPRHFARQCARILKDDGFVIVSTPNIDSTDSILLNLQLGHHHWFSEFNYRTDGHITPVGQWQIKKSFLEAGFKIQWEGSFGNESGALSGSPRMRLLRLALDQIRSVPKGLRGEIYCALFRRA